MKTVHEVPSTYIPLPVRLFSVFSKISQKKAEQLPPWKNIQNEGNVSLMAVTLWDKIIGFSAADHEASGHRSQLEEEVVSLFEQLRMPVLRYVISFGIAVPDAEEIAQEVFLSLFRHLEQGKSNANLQGWIFRVAHNLALKHRARLR